MVRDEAPPSPITPSPRQTNGTWQRPTQTATDNSGHASTSDRDEERSRLRWAINIKKWTPWDDEWLFLLDMLPEEDQKEVESFKFKDDQKRALVSRLLQRQCVAVALGIPWEKVLIKRTKGRKPFVINKGLDKTHAPNFNFNVSHEGDFVVLASEPISICGVDVAAPQQLRARGTQQKLTIPQLKSIFDKQFTPYEWASIDNAGSGDEAKESMFRRLWSLKEALVKARGDGLGFDLSKAEFHFEDGIRSDTASVWIDGRQQTRWRFFLQELSDGHWVSVARGPPENIVDAWREFTGTLQEPDIPGAKFQEALEAPNPAFTMLGIADIIPQRLRDDYADAAGQA
ncbi:4'-phosphopantetheinyl transferase [Coccomyxa subellipsoidea C-169]|uniref:holo-[acyl-carrier-protein] synthase n=1 Tax=Coccomyxa subellipsoidea (strain C-169) TaxID=574566 RepID=I0Z2E8_COCSC|nr:4'-phosphopantetheinyl transferase [Coccomyxa subellipsoidea C-169]EIE24817.1 4'-phosphopantetheinyl transferase [Coccomyxa subellipsoidea C-169]|eukprot:XP_005649361.1 4'-phosphopantetheinyl transferase [Coccomyxa subellipsoidea C-169]